MELRLVGHNMQISDALRDYITRKVQRIGRHLPNAREVSMELGLENSRSQEQRAVAQATLDINGTLLRGEERAANVMAAVDAVVELLDRRIERYKGKTYRSEQVKRAGRGTPPSQTAAEEMAPAEDSPEAVQVGESDRVVKVKHFPIKPMTVDDALFQMEMLGHNFFLFYNSDAASYNVLYSRQDGAYGLIQPEPL